MAWPPKALGQGTTVLSRVASSRSSATTKPQTLEAVVTTLASGSVPVSNGSRLVDGSTVCKIETGTYTGDGSAAKPVALADALLTPLYVKIWTRETSNNTTIDVYESANVIVDDVAGGAAIHPFFAGHTYNNDTHTDWTGIPLIIADTVTGMGVGSFTVDDRGTDGNPNKSGTVYNYLVLGI